MPATLERNGIGSTSANTRKEIEVRRSLPTDTFILKDEDAQEVMWSNGLKADEALPLSLEKSLVAFTVTIDGEPILCFGINPPSLLGNEALIWMLSSDRIKEISYRFVKHSKLYIEYFQSMYPRLWNYVSIENITSIRWLRYLGASFDEAKPFGLYQREFMRFTF